MTAEKDPIQLLRAARQAIQTADYRTAIDCMRLLVRHARETDDTLAESRHLGNLALLHNRIGQSEEALTCMEQALVLARQQNDRVTEDGLLGNMGNVLRELGRHDEAVEKLNEALVVAQEIGDLRGRGIWLGNLGLVYDDLGEPVQAMELHGKAVDVARQLQDKRGLAQRLGNLGNSALAAGYQSEALEHFRETVEIYSELGDRPARALRMGIMGNIYAELGRIEEDPTRTIEYLTLAEDYYLKTLSEARDLGDSETEAALLRGLGNVYGNWGRYDDAVQHFKAARDVYLGMAMDAEADETQRDIEVARELRDARQ